MRQIMDEHKAAIGTHRQAIAHLVKNPNVSLEAKFILENVRIDFFDVTTGDFAVSVPREVHLMILTTSPRTNQPVTKAVEILEAHDPLSDALDSLNSLGLSVNMDAKPQHSETMNNGTKSYMAVNLQLGRFAQALNLSLSDNMNPETVLENVAQLVVEKPTGSEGYVRDFLHSPEDNRQIFST